MDGTMIMNENDFEKFQMQQNKTRRKNTNYTKKHNNTNGQKIKTNKKSLILYYILVFKIP